MEVEDVDLLVGTYVGNKLDDLRKKRDELNRQTEEGYQLVHERLSKAQPCIERMVKHTKLCALGWGNRPGNGFTVTVRGQPSRVDLISEVDVGFDGRTPGFCFYANVNPGVQEAQMYVIRNFSWSQPRVGSLEGCLNELMAYLWDNSEQRNTEELANEAARAALQCAKRY